jgi:hypothetical protein
MLPEVGRFAALSANSPPFLGPDVHRNVHDIECQVVDRVTSNFLTFTLREVITEDKATIVRDRRRGSQIHRADC